jgi:hypothetical protein
MRHAFETTAFYRGRWSAMGLDPESLREPADWARLPILERRDLQEHGGCMISSRAPRGLIASTSTSGSSGTPTAWRLNPNLPSYVFKRYVKKGMVPNTSSRSSPAAGSGSASSPAWEDSLATVLRDDLRGALGVAVYVCTAMSLKRSERGKRATSSGWKKAETVGAA